MPIVRPYPIGELSTQPLPDVQPGVPAAGDTSLFGGNRASDLQRAGPQLGQASDSLFALYERKATEANETRIQDLNNRFITRMQDVLHTGPDAFHKREGADAIQAAGATTETLKALKALKAEIVAKAVNGYQRNRLAPILDTHFASGSEQIARHVDRQQEVYDRNVAAASIEVVQREATTNPGNLAGAVTRAVGAVRVLYKGQAPEVIESESRKAVSQIVSSLIRDRLVRNDPSAVDLYRQYGAGKNCQGVRQRRLRDRSVTGESSPLSTRGNPGRTASPKALTASSATSAWAWSGSCLAPRPRSSSKPGAATTTSCALIRALAI